MKTLCTKGEGLPVLRMKHKGILWDHMLCWLSSKFVSHLDAVFFVLFINKDRSGENHKHRNPSTLIPSLLFSTFRCLGFRCTKGEVYHSWRCGRQVWHSVKLPRPATPRADEASRGTCTHLKPVILKLCGARRHNRWGARLGGGNVRRN